MIGPRRRVDIALPSQVPFADLFPTIARFCGLDQDDLVKEPGGWVLQRLGQPPFGLSATPASEGLYDGELIYLRPKSVEMPAMESDDIADEIASLHDGPGRWSPMDTQKIAVGAGTTALLAGAVVLARSGPDWTIPAIVSGVMALVLLVAAIATSRAAGHVVAATMLGCAALPYAFVAGVAGVAATVHHPGLQPTFLHGNALGTLSGFALVMVAAIIAAVGVARGLPTFFGLALAGFFGAGAAVITYADPTVPPAGAAALVAFPALVLWRFIPPIAFRFAGLAMPQVPASADDLRNDALLAPQRDVKTRAVVADHVVTGAVAGMALTGVGAELALGFGHGWLTAVTLAAVACAMLLHSRVFRGRIQRLSLLGGGYAGLAWLAIAYTHVVNVAALLAAAGLVVAVGSWLPGHRPSPFWGRAADIVDYLVTVAVLGLGLDLAGVFAFFHGLSG
ncbi:MAG: type VII secretion integral membrane protein EccD [Nocardiopsaceae bacterium]|nr:type VII secretion integral membrane protein EccD [Nocardiopsaceae bacterium]